VFVWCLDVWFLYMYVTAFFEFGACVLYLYLGESCVRFCCVCDMCGVCV